MFKKYPSIENSYREKHIQRFLRDFPELKDCQYILTEKRDGSNICLLFYPDGNYNICTRNRILGNDEDFYDVKKVLPYYQELIDFGKNLAFDNKCNIYFYGEIFGQGIQKRINYGDDKFFEIFDIGMSDQNDNFKMLPQMYIHSHEVLKKFMVPVIGFISGIENAINYIPENFDEIEGVVIKPYEKVYTNVVGKMFYLKNKNPKFKEKGDKKKKSEKPKYSERAEELKREFNSYITKNRLLSVFSKEGEIEDQKEIGKYIKLVLEDAKEDFYKDNQDFDEGQFGKDEIKYIFNAGAIIVEFLKDFL